MFVFIFCWNEVTSENLIWALPLNVKLFQNRLLFHFTLLRILIYLFLHKTTLQVANMLTQYLGSYLQRSLPKLKDYSKKLPAQKKKKLRSTLFIQIIISMVYFSNRDLAVVLIINSILNKTTFLFSSHFYVCWRCHPALLYE